MGKITYKDMVKNHKLNIYIEEQPEIQTKDDGTTS